MENLLIGGIAGVIARTATSPIEIYKTQCQNRQIADATISNLIKTDGIKGLWRGNMINCVRIFPQMSINYYIFEKAIERLNYSTITNNFISGLISGSTSMIIIYPFETIKTHLSLQKGNYNNPYEVIKSLGIKNLYKGLGTSIIGYGPFTAISFTSYRYYKSIYNNDNEYGKIFLGGMSGITALSLTYPTDLIRKRLQVQGFRGTPKYKGIIDCVKYIVKNEGVGGLYKGLTASYIKVFPTIAIQLYSIEYLKKWVVK